MKKKHFFFLCVHIIISLSRCAGHRNNNNESHLLGFTWGTDVCNCRFLLKGRRPDLRGQLLQLCAEDDSRGKGFSQRAERLSETCGWWEGKREHNSEERARILIKYLHFKCCTAGRDVAGSGEFLGETKISILQRRTHLSRSAWLLSSQSENALAQFSIIIRDIL